MRKVLWSFLPILALFALTIMPIVQATTYYNFYYPTYTEAGIIKIKGSVQHMIADRYTGKIRFNCDAYGINPYISEVYAWMIQSWTANGGENTRIKVFVRLTGLMGVSGRGWGELKLTLKAWWTETRWTGTSGTYGETSWIYTVGPESEDKWFDNELVTLQISFYNPWQSGRDDDGSYYSLKMGLFVEGYARGDYGIWFGGQAYLRFYNYGSNTCWINVDHFTLIRST